MKVNGDAIYGTTASPFEKLDWGRCTQKRLSANKTRLYLHVFNWPADGQLQVPALQNRVLKAALLAGGKRLSTTPAASGLTILVPTSAPDKIATVVVLDIEGAPRTK